jgi:phosphoribosylformylglycinamidine synthase II
MSTGNSSENVFDTTDVFVDTAVSFDTVAKAAETPDVKQPFRELGMTEDEYLRVREILGRRPSSSELAMYSVMWSEHCSYKSSRVHLKQFGEKAPKTAALLVGPGENAGVVDVGEGLAVTFKVESHNHPSYVEPYQGAATGVGGIVRDILTMGARPIAVMDPLRFGPADAPDTARVLPGVVAGIGGYGNCLGVPNIGGEIVFDPCYLGNPLVNALCVGVMRADEIKLAKAPGPGNQVILFGARTGGDGIGGASVLASATFDEDGPAKRPSVQVGDPFMEKVLIECCLEIFAADLVVGIQDLGAAGLTCSTTELAAAGTGGMDVRLDRAPLRDSTLTPEEVLMSESQERMMAVVEPAKVEAFLAVCEKWDVTATALGEVTDTGRLRMWWHGEVIVDVPPRTLAHEGPVYNRPFARPEWQDALQADVPTADRLKRPGNADELRATLLRLVGSPNLADKTWAVEQYDHRVQGNTVLGHGEDSGMVRLDAALPGTSLGVALSTDGNGRFTKLDPYQGAQLALAEAYRNVAATGAKPLAVTDCLNFGSPEDPDVMWQFAEACRGLADACLELGTPVTGGNVSFYNQTGELNIHPTPVVGVLGVIDDVDRRTRSAFEREGEILLLLGGTRDEFGGSEWAHEVHGHLGGLPPRLDLGREKVLGEVLIAGSRDGMLSAAHDLSDGGLAQAVVESCLRGGHGARLVLPETDADGGALDPFVALFSESAGRALVAVPRSEELRFTDMCVARGLPVARVGVVDGTVLSGEAVLEVQGQFTVPMAELRAAHEAPFRKLFGHSVVDA